MFASFENGGGTNFIGCAVFGDNQADVVIALQDLIYTVMQEADADNAFSGADLLGGAGAALGVLGNVLVQFNKVSHGFIMALDLDHSVDHQFGRAGGVRVGQPDQAFVFGLEQVIPGLGCFQVQAGQLFLVDHEAQDALVNAVPVSFRIPVVGLQQVGSIHCFIGFQQAILSCFVVGIIRAAKPYVSGGIPLFLSNLGLNLTGTQPLIFHVDAIQFLELFARLAQILFLTGTVYNQFSLILGGGDQIIQSAFSESRNNAQQHRERKQ